MKRPWRGDNALAAPVFAVPVERLLRGPAFENEIEGFAQALVAVGIGKTTLVGEQRARKAGAEAEDKAAAADDMIGDRGLGRGIDRMMQVNELDGRSHADALGDRRSLAHQQFRHRERVDLVDIDRLAMMLADIAIAKAELIGQHDLGEVLFVRLGCGGVRAKAVGEKAEFHVHSLRFLMARYDPCLGLTTRLDSGWTTPPIRGHEHGVAHLRRCAHAGIPRVVGGGGARGALPAPADRDRRCRRPDAGVSGAQSERPASGHRRRRLRVVQSLAITLYLAKKYSFGKLYPSMLESEARAWQWSFWAIAEVDRGVNIWSLHAVRLPPDERDAALREEALKIVAAPFKVLDAAVATQPFLLGDDFTVADLNVAAVISRAVDMDLSTWPHLKKWLLRCLDRPAARAALKLKTDSDNTTLTDVTRRIARINRL